MFGKKEVKKVSDVLDKIDNINLYFCIGFPFVYVLLIAILGVVIGGLIIFLISLGMLMQIRKIVEKELLKKKKGL